MILGGRDARAKAIAVPSRKGGSRFVRSYGTVLALVVICAIFAVTKPNIFLTATNVRNIFVAVAILSIVATMQTLVMVLGDFDLSVGTLMSLVSVVVGKALLANIGIVPSILVGIALGAFVGVVNGFLISYLRLSAFVATLATMTSLSGAAFLASSGTTVFGLPTGFNKIGSGFLGPIPIPVIFMIVVLAVAYLVMARTTIGRRWYAVGGNREASFLSGLRVKYLRFMVFVISGAGAGLAGVLLAGRLASGHPQAGDTFMLQSLAAAFLGMTAFKDGQANIPGTIVGVFILGVLNNGLDINGVSSYTKTVVTGLVIIVAVVLSSLARKNQQA